MNIQIKQVSKGPDMAEFCIYINEINTGTVLFQGNKGSVDGTIKICVFDSDNILHEKQLKHSKHKLLKNERFYTMRDETAENFITSMYVRNTKLGVFEQYKSIRFYYHNFFYGLHPLNVENGNSFIFKGGKPITVLEEVSVDYTDLHNYRMEIQDDDDCVPCVLLCSYLYVISNFKSNKEKIYEKICEFFNMVFRKKGEIKSIT